MATRLGEMEKLARRCQRAGWRVEESNDGWKVWDDATRVHVLHRSISDGRAGMANQLRDLKRGGLLEAEKRTRSERNNKRAEAARELKFQAEKQLEDAQRRADAQADMINRVSGPYMVDPENVDLEWLVQPHPAPWMRWVNVTPEQMDYILEHHNGNNRPPSRAQIMHYRNIILSGQWKLTHQGLAFDTTGTLQDGQHRGYGLCAARDALVEEGRLDEAAKLVLPFAVFVGMPEENFAAIDEGLLRRAGQLFHMGAEKYASNLPSMLRLVQAYKEPNPRQAMRERVTNAATLDFFKHDPDNYRDAVRWSSMNWKPIGAPMAGVGAAWYIIGKQNGFDNPYFHAFFEGMSTGVKVGTRMILDDDDPRATARRKFDAIKVKGARTRSIDALAIILLCWNNFVLGKSVRYLAYNDETVLPAVRICKPGEGAKPPKLTGEDLRFLMVGQEAREKHG